MNVKTVVEFPIITKLMNTMEGTGKYNPVKDHKGDYFIFEQEFIQCGLGVLTAYFAPIMDEII